MVLRRNDSTTLPGARDRQSSRRRPAGLSMSVCRTRSTSSRARVCGVSRHPNRREGPYVCEPVSKAGGEATPLRPDSPERRVFFLVTDITPRPGSIGHHAPMNGYDRHSDDYNGGRFPGPWTVAAIVMVMIAIVIISAVV